jgi:hypothetical protein
MFILLVVLLWSLAVIYMVIDLKNESNRWLSITCFLGGLLGLYHTFEYLIPRSDFYRSIMGLCSILSLSFAYPFLMYSLSINEYYRKRKRKWRHLLATVLLLPPLVSFFLYHPADFIRPMKFPVILSIALWAVPYILVIDFNFINSYLKETNLKLRVERLSNCIIFVPTMIIVAILSYVLPVAGFQSAWRYQNWALSFMLIIYFIIATRYGFFGFKLSFKKYSLDDTMKVTSVGTSILNHAIKNETIKISICAENLMNRFQKSNQNTEELKIIINSATHMLNMISRIQEKTQEIFLVENENNFNEIIDTALSISKPLLDNRKIVVRKSFAIKARILCDKVHMIEVICNIIQNAVEAMNEKGRLWVNFYQIGNEIVLAIQDNGTGISPQNMPHIMEPFFSTKNRLSNYGLGLCYVYNVMKKHKGKLDVTSEENKGTLVMIGFPSAKAVHVETNTDEYALKDASNIHLAM